MKRWIPITLAILIIGPVVFISQSDILLLGLSILMLLGILMFIFGMKREVMYLTSWAKRMPGQAQATIVVAEIIMMILGFVFGWIMFSLGHVFSIGLGMLFIAITAIAFLECSILS